MYVQFDSMSYMVSCCGEREETENLFYIDHLRIVWFLSRIETHINHGPDGHWHKLSGSEGELLIS
jgi:hypothetical protein